MAQLQLFALFYYFAFLAVADPLLTVLQREGFTEFAQRLEGPDGEAVLSACPDMIIFAPTNAAIVRANSCGLGRRDDGTEVPNPEQHATSQPKMDLRRQSGVTPPLGGVALMNLLDDPEFVNLGPGQNSSVVQKDVANAALGVVYSGLGDSVQISGLDIPYDCGVIRPISGVFTLPALLSETLADLGTTNALSALERTGLLADLDNRTSITFLAPDNSAFSEISGDDELAQALRQQVLLGPPAYSPLLVDGASYDTLAGTTVTVSMRDANYYIGDALILASDAVMKNGVTHVVDKVCAN
ncbi:Periostin [Madurella mycetomatis]|uniref:Periostin n=1 Tax=Madurella mycetomatis TaxID=100816 RepID=A0A175VSW8_9PEZI|nr:Periostin [Madurella mycetomatis]